MLLSGLAPRYPRWLIPGLAPGLALCQALLALVAQSATARAQQYSPYEAGIGAFSETASQDGVENYVGARHLFAGPQGRFDWNLSPSLAIEGSVGYLPGFQPSSYGDNGHELLALGGIKAGWRGRRFGLYGKAEPGISSWTPGFESVVGTPQDFKIVYSRRTDFTMDLGGVLEAYPTPRLTFTPQDATTHPSGDPASSPYSALEGGFKGVGVGN